MSVNKQILLGHIGQIEKKSFDWGSVTKFSLATNEKYKKKNGEDVKETTWHQCEAFGAIADVIAKFFKKGDMIYVEGKTKHEKYNKDGVEKYATKINVDRFSFVAGTKKPDTEQSEPDPEPEKQEEKSPDLPF